MGISSSSAVLSARRLGSCVLQLGACLLLAVIYVASLYVWKSRHDRNHPSTIKRRFFSVLVMSIISPLFLYICTAEETLDKVSLWELLGFRLKGIVYAIVVPLLLTMTLFLGPISMKLLSNKKCEVSPGTETVPTVFWASNLIWWRNHVVAPLSEEFTFRACMLPLILPCFQPSTAIFIAPLFFGVAHFHHMYENIKIGNDFKTAFLISCFQSMFTTIFGVYSAFLFVRTGHFVTCFIAHAFCNHMGFPDFAELNTYNMPIKKTIVIVLTIAGFILWCMFLKPATNPQLYNNDVITRLAECYGNRTL